MNEQVVNDAGAPRLVFRGFDAPVAKAYKRLLRFAAKRIRFVYLPLDPVDVVNEAIVRLYAEGIPADRDPVAHLFMVVRRAIGHEARRAARHTNLESMVMQEPMVAQRAPSFDGEVTIEELGIEVLRALQALAEREEDLDVGLLLAAYEEASHADAYSIRRAVLMDITNFDVAHLRAVQKRMLRMLERVPAALRRKALEALGGGAE